MESLDLSLPAVQHLTGREVGDGCVLVGYPETRSRIGWPFAGNTTGWILDFSIIGIDSIKKSRTAEDGTESDKPQPQANETSLLLDD